MAREILPSIADNDHMLRFLGILFLIYIALHVVAGVGAHGFHMMGDLFSGIGQLFSGLVHTLGDGVVFAAALAILVIGFFISFIIGLISLAITLPFMLVVLVLSVLFVPLLFPLIILFIILSLFMGMFSSVFA